MGHAIQRWEEWTSPNCTKTQNLDQSDGDVFMHGSYIPRVTTHKHLGVHINSRLSWQDHIDHVYTDCARKIGILRRLQRKLGSRALRKIFIGAIRPRLEYACPVWSGGNTSKLVKLQELFCCGTRLSYLHCNSDLTITHWCCSSRSNRTWPLLYLTKLLPQLSSHCGYNFEKICNPVPAVKKSSTLTSFFHALLSYGTACHQTSRAAHHSPSLRPFSEHTLKFN